jgi:Tfp pilus assembly protein PilV
MRGGSPDPPRKGPGHVAFARRVRRPAAQRHGVALLEVVLALALFFGVAVTILGGLSVCMRSTTQVREEAQAADLAVTVLSYVQMGVLEAADAGPTPFEDPYADWTWQTAATAVEASVAGLEMTQIEITVKNTLDGYVFRLYELVPNEEDVTSPQPSDSSELSSGGQSSGDRSGGGT